MHVARRVSKLTLLTAMLAVAGTVFAETADDDDRQALVEIVQAVEIGWENGDGVPFRKHFLDFEGARYVETGGQNEGLTDLVEHHVEPEGDALADFDLIFSNVETHIEGNFAWAIVDVELKATIVRTDRYIHKRGYETFLFRRTDGEWKVVHTHSSTRAVSGD